MVPARTAHAVLVILAVLALLLLVAIMLPFGTSLFVAEVLAGALGPWTTRLATALGGHRKLASFLITASVLVAVLGPLSGLGAVLVPQIQSGVGWLRQAIHDDVLEGLVQRVPTVLRPLDEHLQQAIPGTLERFQEIATAQGARAAAVVGNLVSAT